MKILDFGIALDESKRRLTWTGLSATLGTPDYMAPEQIGGRRGDARTDVYAVGTMLYEMLTKNLPFSSSNANALLRAKANEDPKPPSYFVPNLDAALEAIILKAIQRAPRDRFETAAALLAELRDPPSALRRAPDAPRPPPARDGPGGPPARQGRPGRRRDRRPWRAHRSQQPSRRATVRRPARAADEPGRSP